MPRGQTPLALALGCSLTLALTGCSGDPPPSRRTPSPGPASAVATSRPAVAASRPAVGTLRPAVPSGALSLPEAAPTSRARSPRPSGAPTEERARAARTAASQRITFAPNEIRLPGDAAGTPVRPVTTDAQGALRVPGTGQVGWWSGGAKAGAAYGTVVLVGHVDTVEGGRELFARLLTARRGDRITLSGNGSQQQYRVTGVRDLPKTGLPGSAAFDQRVPARLLLITCSGRFDPVTRHYEQNRLVTAVPTGPAVPATR
ncbi:class F sortase [Barrientosiimonas humi]|uniref:class F sortase n=1 Tax=Barrientosiimonas humi TaxID=999931 RepID=UPI00370D5A7F